MSQIPTLDIRRYDTDREAFVADLGAAYREWGFAGIRGHGIPQAQIDRAYDVFQRFFALPEETKRKYHVAGGGGARGYTPFGIETAKGAKYFDLKEFWHVGRDIPRDSTYADVMPPNVWPEEIPEFKDVAYGLYQALDQLGSRVLCALALFSGAVWGKPTWGTYWFWDARITSMLVLLFLYLGLIALGTAISSPVLAARATAVLAIVGAVNLPIIKYSVNWWNTLHQPATFKLTEKPAMVPEMYLPLIVCLPGFYLLFAVVVILRTRNSILERESGARWVRDLAAGTEGR
jgi:hypothetical protein